MDSLFDSANEIMDNIKHDELLQVLRHNAGLVQADLSYVDTEGKTQLDTDMLSKLQSALFPVLAEALKYIPLPRIEQYSPDRDYWLDNIILCSHEIIPENIIIRLETEAELSVRDIESKGSRTFFIIELNKILTEFKDIKFWYRKKTLPALEDSGLVTFRIKGEGARLSLCYNIAQGKLEKIPQAPELTASYSLSEGYATFDIYDMDIEFDTSTIRHTYLLPMLTKIFKVQMKRQIEDAVENNLSGFLAQLGEVMMKTISEVNRPFLTGMDLAKKAVQSSQFARLYEKRTETIE